VNEKKVVSDVTSQIIYSLSIAGIPLGFLGDSKTLLRIHEPFYL